ncbi:MULTISPECIES: hypothetical protein [unclassified Chryseobacterium]
MFTAFFCAGIKKFKKGKHFGDLRVTSPKNEKKMSPDFWGNPTNREFK